MNATPQPRTEDLPPAASAVIGVARRDITAPVGIYARQWGAAKHDVAQGVHRELTLTAVSIREAIDADPLILIGGDMGWFRSPQPDLFERILEPICSALKIDASRIVLNCSHTHAACSITTADGDKPGGELISPYLDKIAAAALEAAREASMNAAPATLTWATGRCALAVNRDLPEPEVAKRFAGERLRTGEAQSDERFLCGYNPDNKADDTLLVGRITRDSDDRTIGTIVNYACHPTTLAWGNDQISPDYVGAMRELVEQYTENSPCLFLQGASGELSPAVQYVGEVEWAERHGRYLGLSVVATLASMLPPRRGLKFQRVVESGAPLAVWGADLFDPDTTVAAAKIDVALPLKDTLPTVDELDALLADCTDRTVAERLYRKKQQIKQLGGGDTVTMPAWVWRVGRTLMVHQANEAYSFFQQALRHAFPDYAVVVTNLSNGACGYISLAENYDLDIYQVWQSPFDRKAMSVLIDTTRSAAAELAGA